MSIPMSTPYLSPPTPARLSKRGSLTPSVIRLLNRYPPAIIDDTPPLTPILETSNTASTSTHQYPLTSFDRRFPQGYKIADASIPLYPDEVPSGYEKIFNPTYSAICKRLFWWGFLFPPLWLLGAYIFGLRRIQLNSIMDPKVYWARVQWLKLNGKYGMSCGMAFLVLFLVVVIIVIVVKTYIPS